MKFQVYENDDFFEIEETKLSPKIILDKKNFTLHITGSSLMEDSKPLFGCLYQHLKEFLSKPTTTSLLVHFHFVYLNTQAVKEILNLLNLLESVRIPVKIIWYYSDDEINDLGTQLSELTNLNLEKIYAEPPKVELINGDKN